MIELRKVLQLKDDPKRHVLLFITVIVVVIRVDNFGGFIISYIFDVPFNYPNRFQVRVPIIIISTMTMAIYEAIYYSVRLKNPFYKKNILNKL